MSLLADVQRWDAKLQVASLQVLPTNASAKAYALTAEQAKTENGGLEIEFVLTAKPDRNVINIPFTKQNAVLYYQPPLNEELNPADYDILTETEAWKDGVLVAQRPENVVGSYAVYHNSKKGNDYKTGKICHIYRPKLIDAKGNTAWADFNKDADKTGILTITLPQDFLDKAIYPVTVDPTFGYTSVGGTSGNIFGYATATHRANVSGTLTQISIYTNAGSPWHVRVCLYQDSSNYPNALIVESASEYGVAGGWKNISFSQAFTGPVWIGMQHDVPGLMLKYDSGAVACYDAAYTYDAFPNPYPSGKSSYNRLWSLYATYTEGATLKEVIDTIGFNDTVLRNKTSPVSDSVGLVDSLLRDKTLTIADSVGTVDSVLGNKTPLVVADSLTLADLVNVISGAIIRTVADSVSLNDVTRVLKILNLKDALSLVDSASTPSRVLRALDAVTPADHALVNKTLQINETVSLAEVVEVGAGGVKKTRLFLILGDLAVQLTGD
jgi:hypothetical protein